MESGYAIGTKEKKIYGVEIQAECVRRCILQKESDDSTIDAAIFVYANDETYCRCISATTSIKSIYSFRYGDYSRLNDDIKNSLKEYFNPKSSGCSPKQERGNVNILLDFKYNLKL